MSGTGHVPTSAEVLDRALAHQAPGLVKVLAEALAGDQLAELAHAIDRRVYIAKKDRDEELTGALDDAGAELLDKALLGQAARVVQLLSEALPANRTGLLRELATAIADRVDHATRRHDEQIARHLDEAADRIRSRYDVARATLARLDEACAGDEDPQLELAAGHG